MSPNSAPRRTRTGRLVLPPLAAASALVLAACSSGASAGGAPVKGSGQGPGLSAQAVSDITALLTEARGPSKFQAPGPAVDATSLKGKTIFVLSDGTNQFTQSFSDGVKAAAAALGMTVKFGSGNSVTTQDVQVLGNAVNAGVAGIIILALDPQTIASGVTKAKAAGIPVVETFIGDPGLPSAAEKAIGVVANGTYCYSCTGELMAAYELLRSGSKTQGAVQQFPGLPSSDAVVAGWKKAMEKWCPDCKTTYQDIPLTATNTQQMANAARVAAQDPKTTVLAPVYDYQVEFEEPAVRSAGAGSRIFVSENADLAQMQELLAGGMIKANVGNPVDWDGWGAVDQLVRAMLGKSPVVDEKLPVRMFDTTNIGTLDLKAPPSTWFGPADYQAEYKKLWGVG